MQTIKQSIKTIILAVIIGLAVTYAFAAPWTGPTDNPPLDNVDTPINIGTATQNLLGDKIIGYTNPADILFIQTGLISQGYFETEGDTSLATASGQVGIGTSNPNDTLEVIGTIRGQHAAYYNNTRVALPTWTTNSSTMVDIPDTSKTLTDVPAGTAVMTWSMSACGAEGDVDVIVQPRISPIIPESSLDYGLQEFGPLTNPFLRSSGGATHCDIYNKSFGGTTIKKIPGGTITVKLEVRKYAGAGSFKISIDDYFMWSLVVYRD